MCAEGQKYKRERSREWKNRERRIRPRVKVKEGQRLEKNGRRHYHGSHESAVTAAMAAPMASC